MVNNLILIRTIFIRTRSTITKQSLRTLCLVLALCGLAACSSTPKNADGKSGVNAFELVAQADKAYKEGRWLEAEQGYRKVIEKVPQDYYAWFRLGNTHLRQGRIDSAINFYNEARKRNPEQSKPYYNVSTAYIFQALNALRQADQLLRENDPGKVTIAMRIRILEKLIDQPVDSHKSPGGSVLTNSAAANSAPVK